MTMMHILLKIKEHLFHMGAHFFASSVSLLDCLVAAGLAKISEKKLFVFIAEDFYVFCIVLVDSIMKVRATEMCVSRKDQPSDVSMVACGPVCVPAFSPVCVCRRSSQESRTKVANISLSTRQVIQWQWPPSRFCTCLVSSVRL